MAKREQTCCFTGHREVPSEQLPGVRKRLETAIVRLVGSGVRYFGAGGALGFDTLAAQTVLELREKFPQIRLVLVLPCADQDARWSAEDVRTYEGIKMQADKVVCLSEQYHRGCMHERNRHLVDHSAHCICYLTRGSSGTAYTVDYAKTNGLSITNLAEPAREEPL